MSINHINTEDAFRLLEKYPPDPALYAQGARPHGHYEGAKAYAKEQLPIETQKKVSLFFMGVGILLILAGVFACLASYKVLPQAANVISNLGTGGQVLSFGMLGSGFLITLIASVAFHSHKKKYDDVQASFDTQMMFAIRGLIPSKLAPKELLVVHAPGYDFVNVFYSNQATSAWVDEDGCCQLGFSAQCLRSREQFMAEAQKKEKYLENDISFITLEALKQRLATK